MHLSGHEAPDGLLVLDASPPLDMHPFSDRNGPTIRISGDDVVIDVSVGPEACGWDVDDRGVGDGVVQWCIQPDGGIWLYANGFSREGKDLLQGVVEDLEVRHVRPMK